MTPTREEFLFLNQAQIFAFYALMAVSVAAMAYQVLQRVRLWMTGRPITWKPDYIGGVVKYVLAQRKVKSSRPRSGAPLHLFIFYGFLTLFIATTILAINKYSPWKFHQGGFYLTYEFVVDWMGLVFVVGVLWALGRRVFSRPRTMCSAPADYWALGLLLALGITGFLVEAMRMSANPQSFDNSAPIGFWLSQRLGGMEANSFVAVWWVHVLLVCAFFVSLPQMRLRHILYAVSTASGSNPDLRMGSLAPISIEDVEQTGQIGVQNARDYSRWHLMSLDACMQCGRCTDVCPANGVGKILDPKKVVQNIRKSQINGKSVADAVGEESLWACTTCNACVEACPVLIRHVDLIVDARRNLVSEGKLSGTAATMLRQMQSTASAWGTPAADREKWMEGMEIPLARELVSRGEKFDLLLWVGCAGATDPHAMKVTRSVAALLKKAGVSFACLGKEERCTGDSARRVGDEFLFQEMAQSNVETFAQYGVKTILTSCPHCFNTLKNEYPQFGGDYEVLHHSQFLARLTAEGKLKTPILADGEVTIHDPCYLSRVNGEVDAQRRLLGAVSEQNGLETPIGQYLSDAMQPGTQIAETRNRGRKTLCCGAGGGRMWMDETPESRPSSRRLEELIETGAKTIAVACPFCRIMLDADKPNHDTNGSVRLADIAELLHEANSD